MYSSCYLVVACGVAHCLECTSSTTCSSCPMGKFLDSSSSPHLCTGKYDVIHKMVELHIHAKQTIYTKTHNCHTKNC